MNIMTLVGWIGLLMVTLYPWTIWFLNKNPDSIYHEYASEALSLSIFGSLGGLFTVLILYPGIKKLKMNAEK